MNLVKRIGIFKDNLKIAVRAIRSNKVRAVLTMCIIAFGIMALVGILTAIDAIKSSLTSQFTLMGANSFTITSRGMNIQAGNDRQRMRNHSTITYRQAMEFRKTFNEPAWYLFPLTRLQCRLLNMVRRRPTRMSVWLALMRITWQYRVMK